MTRYHVTFFISADERKEVEGWANDHYGDGPGPYSLELTSRHTIEEFPERTHTGVWHDGFQVLKVVALERSYAGYVLQLEGREERHLALLGEIRENRPGAFMDLLVASGLL